MLQRKMKHSKGDREKWDEEGGKLLFFNRMDREGLSGKVMFEQTSS